MIRWYAVSYTHLDVYKRQGGDGGHRGAGAERGDGRPGNVLEHLLHCALAAAEPGEQRECDKDVDEAQGIVDDQRPGIVLSLSLIHIYGYPLPLAATVALRTIMEFLAGRALPERVRMVCHSEAAAEVYRQTWNLWYAEDKDQRL